MQISTRPASRPRAYREANREKVRARQRKYDAAKRAKAKERGDPDAMG